MRKLSKSLAEMLELLAEGLREAEQEGRDYFDERSDKWKESDKGVAYESWLEQLGAAADALESLPAQPDE